MHLCCSCCVGAHSHTKFFFITIVCLRISKGTINNMRRMLTEANNSKCIDLLCSIKILDCILSMLKLCCILFYFSFSKIGINFWYNICVGRCDCIYHKIALFIRHYSVCSFNVCSLQKLLAISEGMYILNVILFRQLLDGKGSSLCAFWNRRGEKTPSNSSRGERRRWAWYIYNIHISN